MVATGNALSIDKPNIERAERMIHKGLMTVAGQKMIDIAKDLGKWVA
jgi:hypothetical protein